MHLINLNGIMVIDDSYNANYDSMSYAIKYLGTLSGRNIAVLGTMKELGDYSSKIHLDIGALISKEEIDILSKYLPEQLSKEEVEKIINEIFEEVKPESQKDMGKVMKEAQAKLKGKADMKEVSTIIREKLQ